MTLFTFLPLPFFTCLHVRGRFEAGPPSSPVQHLSVICL
jgi:hypothetical protein